MPNMLIESRSVSRLCFSLRRRSLSWIAFIVTVRLVPLQESLFGVWSLRIRARGLLYFSGSINFFYNSV